MKEIIRQFYNEGLGSLLYKKPISFINKKIKNKTIVKILSILLGLFYTILILVIIYYYLKNKLKI